MTNALKIEQGDKLVYYHPSFQTEVLHEPTIFYTEHMTKIAQRMDDLNKNGSNLIIDSL